MISCLLLSEEGLSQVVKKPGWKISIGYRVNISSTDYFVLFCFVFLCFCVLCFFFFIFFFVGAQTCCNKLLSNNLIRKYPYLKFHMSPLATIMILLGKPSEKTLPPALNTLWPILKLQRKQLLLGLHVHTYR